MSSLSNPSRIFKIEGMEAVLWLVKCVYVLDSFDVATFTRDRGYIFRSVWDWIPLVYTVPFQDWNGSVPHGITFIIGPDLVPDSRSDPYLIHQLLYELEAYL